MVDPLVIKCLRKCEDGRSASLFSSATSDQLILGTATRKTCNITGPVFESAG